VKYELSDMLEAGKENAPPPRYSVDDAVAAGRKRQRRRTVLTGAGSAAVVVAVATAIAVPQIVTDKGPATQGNAAPAAASKAAAPAPFAYPADNFTGNITGFKSGDLTVTDTVHVTPGYQVAVVVYRKGVYDPKKIKTAEQVTVDGHAGYFQKSLPGKAPEGLKGKIPASAFDTPASLAWQYDDNAWAVVSVAARVKATQQEVAAIAAKVTAGAAKPVTVDFKLSYVPKGYELAAAGPSSVLNSPLEGESYVRLLKGDFPYRGLTAPAQDPFVVNDKQLPVVQLTLYPKWNGKYRSATTPSCPEPGLCYRTTDNGKYELELSGGGFLSDPEMIKMLNSVTFADPSDPGTWFKATDAV